VIRRDQFGIICQHSHDRPEELDGGDSCSRTGIMARSGSLKDLALLPKFIVGGKFVVRHPAQPKFSDPKETSRDAIICFFAAQSSDENVGNAAFHYANSWFVNKDFLDPALKLALYKRSPFDAPLWLEGLGRVWLWIALLWNCFIMPEHEQNQFASVCLIMGRPWITRLYAWHPDLNYNIRKYFQGWRDQDEIGFAYMETIRAAVYGS